MRWLVSLFLVFFIAAVAYIIWPIYTALQIREAIRAGDTATLTRKIEWPSVRTSLKASMSAEALAALETAPGAPKPNLWQRIKATVKPAVASSAIDRYVTPEHFPVFLGYRRVWRGTTQPAIAPPEQPTVLAGTWLGGTSLERLVAFYGRIRRAVFHSLTRFELEVVDRHNTGRAYIGTLELKDWEWKLTGLIIATVPASSAVPSRD